MEIRIRELDEIIDLYKVAQNANGAILYKKGRAVLLACVAVDRHANIEGDFVPLTVQYIEKSYAAGKFPGGYIKREGKPNEFEILTSRLIDRSIRPLFPKGFFYPVQISVFVLSVDNALDLQVLALNAASLALYISDIPISISLNCIRIAKINDDFILNPRLDELAQSSIDLFVAGYGEQISMIEFKSNIDSLNEDLMMQALNLAKNKINEYSNIYEKYLNKHIKTPLEFLLKNILEKDSIDAIMEMAYDFIKKYYMNLAIDYLKDMAQSESSAKLEDLADIIFNGNKNEPFSKSFKHYLEDKNNLDEESCKKKIMLACHKIQREFMRDKILNEGIRADGRNIDEIREISIDTNLLPNAHGSALFARGQTQVLAVCTVGNNNDMQQVETLSNKQPQKFLFHYNFPSFCTGEAYPISSPTRRELGHGNLAKKALESSIRDEMRVIRIVSEVLSSNGSSSMASVCGGSISLFAAGLKPQFLIAGIAMGLIKEGEKYKILTDITGLEDYDGDMDFKVAGNENGITALQMDIKIKDISLEILQNALAAAKTARLKILALMQESMQNMQINMNLPQMEKILIKPHKIPLIIGQGGKTIRQILDNFEVSIDINKESGEISIFGSMDSILGAKERILKITTSPLDSLKIGDKYDGVIKKITDFGMFVEIKDGIDGLIRKEKLQNAGLNLGDYAEGAKLEVVIISKDNNKIELFIS